MYYSKFIIHYINPRKLLPWVTGTLLWQLAKERMPTLGGVAGAITATIQVNFEYIIIGWVNKKNWLYISLFKNIFPNQ